MRPVEEGEEWLCTHSPHKTIETQDAGHRTQDSTKPMYRAEVWKIGGMTAAKKPQHTGATEGGEGEERCEHASCLAFVNVRGL